MERRTIGNTCRGWGDGGMGTAIRDEGAKGDRMPCRGWCSQWVSGTLRVTSLALSDPEPPPRPQTAV